MALNEGPVTSVPHQFLAGIDAWWQTFQSQEAQQAIHADAAQCGAGTWYGQPG